MKKTTTRHTIVMLLLVILTSAPVFGGKRKPQLFGPTGFTGTFYRRVITVKTVEKGSPADHKIKPGDQIIGMGKTKFKASPLPNIALAIDKAEASDGKLSFLLKGDKGVVIQLKKLGSYSPTAPYNCPKTDKIISLMAESLANTKKLQVGATNASILGLMATGEKKYLDTAAKLIKSNKMMKPDPTKIAAMQRGELDMGAVSWRWGYNLITLGEYHLLTKDASVLSPMRIYALALARGQDAGGLWGHRMATPSSNGRLAGYAQMNQPSLSCFMGILFAKKCGIDDPEIDRAIEKSSTYFKDYIGKGTLPYGVHGPQVSRYNNNGMSASAAICMALQGNRHGASFFSKLSAASHDNLQQGHASAFFNPLWTPLGANLAGPEVTQQFFKKSLWYHNIRRRWNGEYGWNGKEGAEAGSALLAYCLPRKALIITGREADKSLWLKGQGATDVVMMSQINYKEKSTDQLIAMLDHPIPQITYQAIEYLQKREVNEVVPKLLALVENGNEQEKGQALSYFRQKRPKDLPAEKVVAELGSIVRNKNETLKTRISAALALGFGKYDDQAYPYYNDVLRLMDVERPEANPLDFIDHTSRDIAYATARLCNRPWDAGLITDKTLLYKVALQFMDHKRQEVRGCGVVMLIGMPLEDFHIVADKVIHILDNKDPTYHSYHNSLNTSLPGVTLLAELDIKEGMDYLLDIIFNQGGKWGFKIKLVMQTLPLYGGNAKPYIPKFEAHRSIAKEGDRFHQPWKDMVKKIEQDKNPKKLISLKEAKEMGEMGKRP